MFQLLVVNNTHPSLGIIEPSMLNMGINNTNTDMIVDACTELEREIHVNYTLLVTCPNLKDTKKTSKSTYNLLLAL